MPCAADPSDAGQKGQEFRDAIAAKLEKLQEPPPAKQATVRGGPPLCLTTSVLQIDSFGPRPLARRSEFTVWLPRPCRQLCRTAPASVANRPSCEKSQAAHCSHTVHRSSALGVKEQETSNSEHCLPNSCP